MSKKLLTESRWLHTANICQQTQNESIPHISTGSQKQAQNCGSQDCKRRRTVPHLVWYQHSADGRHKTKNRHQRKYVLDGKNVFIDHRQNDQDCEN